MEKLCDTGKIVIFSTQIHFSYLGIYLASTKKEKSTIKAALLQRF